MIELSLQERVFRGIIEERYVDKAQKSKVEQETVKSGTAGKVSYVGN